MKSLNYKPTTPARRQMSRPDKAEITHDKKPLRQLTKILKKHSGRNNQGRITTRHHGGGTRRFYRIISNNLPQDFEGVVVRIENDPNRSANIALLESKEHGFKYIIAPKNVKVGQTIKSSTDAHIEIGNRLTLAQIPEGTTVHNIELTPGKGGQIVRSAGASAQVMAKENGYAQLRMPSGEVRLVLAECQATIGVVGNETHQNMTIGSAGRKRRMGVKPTVRGKVMNAVDHPHGGGDGGAHGVGRNPKTPWGQVALGYRTRRNKKTNKMIVRTRHQAKRK